MEVMKVAPSVPKQVRVHGLPLRPIGTSRRIQADAQDQLPVSAPASQNGGMRGNSNAHLAPEHANPPRFRERCPQSSPRDGRIDGDVPAPADNLRGRPSPV